MGNCHAAKKTAWTAYTTVEEGKGDLRISEFKGGHPSRRVEEHHTLTYQELKACHGRGHGCGLFALQFDMAQSSLRRGQAFT